MVNSKKITEDWIWSLLKDIPDPEVPVLTITDLGVVRKVHLTEGLVNIDITPTYTGCPAMKVFEDEIIKKLKLEGVESVKVNLVYAPAWTTDWIGEEAREKLRRYGIAPPVKGSADKGELFATGRKIVRCPRCNKENTELRSQFGSTACKALYFCKDCIEPFEYFKCI